MAAYDEVLNEERAEKAWTSDVSNPSECDNTSEYEDEDEEFVDDEDDEDYVEEVEVNEGEKDAVIDDMPLKEGKILRLKSFCVTRWFSSWLVMERVCSLYQPLLRLNLMIETGEIALPEEKREQFITAMMAIDETMLLRACCFLFPLVQGINYCQRDSTLQMDIPPMMESIHGFYMNHSYSMDANPLEVILPISREVIVDSFKSRECLFYTVPKDVRDFFFDQFFAEHGEVSSDSREFQEKIREYCDCILDFVNNCSKIPEELKELFRCPRGHIFCEVTRFMNERGYRSSLATYMSISSQLLPHLYALYQFLFIQPASSASVERSFSILNHIQTGSRNRIGCTTLRNLLFIKMNYSIGKKCGWRNEMRSFLHSDKPAPLT